MIGGTWFLAAGENNHGCTCIEDVSSSELEMSVDNSNPNHTSLRWGEIGP